MIMIESGTWTFIILSFLFLYIFKFSKYIFKSIVGPILYTSVNFLKYFTLLLLKYNGRF